MTICFYCRQPSEFRDATDLQRHIKVCRKMNPPLRRSERENMSDLPVTLL